MSLIASFQKKSKLENAIKQVAKARKDESKAADQLYKHVYQTFAEVIHDDPLRAQALYNWGAALLYQAKSKAGDEAIALYDEAISKFSFCRIIDPNYLAAAIDSGVAYMDQARIKNVVPDDVLYDQAKKQFERANEIQAGTASYNLACIYGLRGDQDGCLKALQKSKEKASLPDVIDIIGDPDMASVKDQEWFVAFIEELTKLPEVIPEPELTPEELAAQQEKEDRKRGTNYKYYS